MFRAAKSFALPIASLVCLSFGAAHAFWRARPLPHLPPSATPASSQFADAVASTGVVEPQTEKIMAGSSTPGIVVEVMAKVGQQVKTGDALFRLDDRDLTDLLAVREAECERARAQLKRVRNTPRPEELPEARARVAEAQARHVAKLDQFHRNKTRRSRGWINDEQLVARQQEYYVADAQLKQAKARLALLEAGPSAQDVEAAEQGVRQAEAQVALVKNQLDRLTVRALGDARVLQVNVRPGEYVGPANNRGLVVLGDVDVLHLRANIDEDDIPRFEPSARATAEARGNSGRRYPLRFVRVEPLVVDKHSLTGDGVERVDVRVLQAIYAIDAPAGALFVGQQMDVFIDAAE